MKRMTLFRLGKQREATTLTAETFKAAVREYMESMGFAQLTDSSIEGHQPDMIFAAPPGRPWPREVWVEAKATKLTLSDKNLLTEIRGYMRQWASRERIARFKFMIFVKRITNVSRWERIWGSDLSRDEIFKWLKSTKQSSSSESVPQLPTDEDVLTFFAETDVVEGDIPSLRTAAQAKRNVGSASLNLRRQAQERLHLMEQREKPVSKKSNLISNLLRFTPPGEYGIIQFQKGHKFSQENQPTKIVTPYSIIDESELITFESPDMLDTFHSANQTQVRHISLSEAMEKYETNILELWNRALNRIIRVQGVERWRDWYYFPVPKGHEARIIVTDSEKKLQVGRVFYKQTNALGATPEISFVFHRAFAARSKWLWGQPFVELRMRRLFTKDGLEVLDPEAISKIDRKFRRSIFNRSETQLQMLLKLGEFLFRSPSIGDKHEAWMSKITFQSFLTMSTNWTPDAVSLDQSFISDYEVEEGSEDADD